MVSDHASRVKRIFLFVDSHLMEHLDKFGVAVVYNLAAADVEPRNLRHILAAELEIPDIHILFHALLVDRFGDDGDASLDVPAQGYLGSTLAVLLADSG